MLQTQTITSNANNYTQVTYEEFVKTIFGYVPFYKDIEWGSVDGWPHLSLYLARSREEYGYYALNFVNTSLPLPPSWRIETSLGLYSCGYLLDSPMDKHDLESESLYEDLKHYVPYPEYAGTFARVLEWRPDRRYSRDQIIDIPYGIMRKESF